MLSKSQVITAICISMGGLSFIGSAFMLFCFVRYQEANLMSRMVAWLALSDFLFAIGNLMGDAGTYGFIYDAPVACYVQGVIRAWGALCSMFLSAAIAFVLHLKVLRPQSTYFQDYDPKGLYLAAFCWVFSFALSAGPVFTSSYGEVGGFCWIVANNTLNMAWRYAQVYLWMFVTVFYCGWLWFSISRKMKAISPGSELESERRTIVSKSIWYPLILVITRFPGLVERLLDTIGHLSFFWLSVTHTTLSNSNGWLNAIVYGMTPVIKLKIKQDIATCFFAMGFADTIIGLKSSVSDDDEDGSYSKFTAGGTHTLDGTINNYGVTIAETPENDGFS